MVEKRIASLFRCEEAYMDLWDLSLSEPRWVTVATLECGHRMKTRKEVGEIEICKVCSRRAKKGR